MNNVDDSWDWPGDDDDSLHVFNNSWDRTSLDYNPTISWGHTLGL